MMYKLSHGNGRGRDRKPLRRDPEVGVVNPALNMISKEDDGH
jgi:hypothetical protein